MTDTAHRDIATHWSRRPPSSRSVLLMIVPLPPLLLDLLLSVDIGLAVVLLLTAIYVREPVQFSVFPSLLLLLTLLRLSLNVAATRLILLHGAGRRRGRRATSSWRSASSWSAATSSSASSSSSSSSRIQFVVINHGAVRISEVTARFTLDAMPGKQMAIDADLNAGLIDEREAQRRGASGSGARPTSTARWTAPSASRSATRWPPCSSRRQHRRRPDHRRAAARPRPGHGGADLHHPDRRRRAGHRHPGPAGVDVGRSDHDARGVRVEPGRGSRRPAARAAAAAGRRRRRAGRARARSPACRSSRSSSSRPCSAAPPTRTGQAADAAASRRRRRAGARRARVGGRRSTR